MIWLEGQRNVALTTTTISYTSVSIGNKVGRRYSEHRAIHAKLHDIPTPNGKDCWMAVEVLENWLETGYISYDDPLDKRIEMIAKCFRARCPATTAMLDWQKDIVAQFYRGG